MQTGIRHADEVRNYLRDNLLTAYYPAATWQEDKSPFTIADQPIIYCRQEGQGVDAFMRQVSVDVYLFSKQGCTDEDMSALYNDAVSAMEYIRANPEIQEFNLTSVTQDVTGEYYTGQNRRYYRFTVICYSMLADD